MSDPLLLLRDFNAAKKEIVEKNTRIFFDHVSFPKEVKTNYLRTRQYNDAEQDNHYTLQSILFLLKNAKLPHPTYVRQSIAAKVPTVRLPDRKDLLAFLNGEVTTTSSIDKGITWEELNQNEPQNEIADVEENKSSDHVKEETKNGKQKAHKDSETETKVKPSTGTKSKTQQRSGIKRKAPSKPEINKSQPDPVMIEKFKDSPQNLPKKAKTAQNDKLNAELLEEMQLSSDSELDDSDDIEPNAERPLLIPSQPDSVIIDSTKPLDQDSQLKSNSKSAGGKSVEVKSSPKKTNRKTQTVKNSIPENKGKKKKLTECVSVESGRTETQTESPKPIKRVRKTKKMSTEMDKMLQTNKSNPNEPTDTTKPLDATVEPELPKIKREKPKTKNSSIETKRSKRTLDESESAGGKRKKIKLNDETPLEKVVENKEPEKKEEPPIQTGTRKIKMTSVEEVDKLRAMEIKPKRETNKKINPTTSKDVTEIQPETSANKSIPAMDDTGFNFRPPVNQPCSVYKRPKPINTPITVPAIPQYDRYRQEIYLQPVTFNGFIIDNLGSATSVRPPRPDLSVPIMIVPPPDSGSLITLYNVKEIFEDFRFVGTEDKVLRGCERKDEVYVFRRRKEGTTPYRVIDDVSKLRDEDWIRVFAIFVHDPVKEFVGWPFNGNPEEILLRFKGEHLKWHDAPTDPNFEKLFVTCTRVNRFKRDYNYERFRLLWRCLERHIQKYKPFLRC